MTKGNLTRLGGFLESKRGAIADISQAGVDPDRLIKAVLSMAMQNPDVGNCDQRSILQCAMRLAEIGLYPNQRFGPWVIKRGDLATLDLGAGGWKQACLLSGVFTRVECHAIREGEPFEIRRGHVPPFDHKVTAEDIKKDAPVIGFYAWFIRSDGSQEIRQVYISELKKLEKMSRGKAWSTNWEAMARTKALKIACVEQAQGLPHDNPLVMAAAADVNEWEAGGVEPITGSTEDKAKAVLAQRVGGDK
jgi:phage RecT family recombinase